MALAIVLDDSLSMRAKLPGGTTRWARAPASAARELTRGRSARVTKVAIVLAGAPARVVLGSTTTMAAVTEALRASLEPVGPRDRPRRRRAGSPGVCSGGSLQRDKRVVVLSDLADGSPPEAPPLGGDGEIALWAPHPEIEADGQDCAVTRADRSSNKVWARVVCTSTGPPAASAAASASPAPPGEPLTPGPSAGRSVEVRAGRQGTRVGAALGPALVRTEEIALELPPGAPEILRAGLTGKDAIAEDDEAPVVAAGGALPMGVVVDAATTHVATGGPPPIEQALTALELDAQVHPLPAVPEHADELNALAALIVDDVPGFTPEVRRTLAAWVERGGVLLLTLGPRAAAAPLGASFDPLVPGVVRWGPSPSPGVDPATAMLLRGPRPRG